MPLTYVVRDASCWLGGAARGPLDLLLQVGLPPAPRHRRFQD